MSLHHYKFAVIGDPVEHSQSPELHKGFLEAAGLNGEYGKIRIPAGTARAELQRLYDEGYDGLNVTTPLKEEVLASLCSIDGDTRMIGAANTLIRTTQGWLGRNTDGMGALALITELLARGRSLPDPAGPFDLRTQRIAVLGTGPTARAALHVMRLAGAQLYLTSRSADKVKAFGDLFACRPWHGEKVDLVFSTLPPRADLDDTLLSTLTTAPLIVDANYGPRSTLAAQLGVPVITGDGMLRAQGFISFQWWTSWNISS